MDFTTNQWAVLFLVLVLGWLLGMLSTSGDDRWRREYEAEHDARLAAEREREDRLAAERIREERIRDEQVRPIDEPRPRPL
jgi:hypothetical protein